MRDRKDTLVNNILIFRLKLTNIAPKKSVVLNQDVTKKAARCKSVVNAYMSSLRVFISNPFIQFYSQHEYDSQNDYTYNAKNPIKGML